MKYSIGTNFDLKLLDVLEEYDKERTIESLFGKLRLDLLGGARGALFLPQISWKQLKRYIEECHKRKRSFNYLINPMCMDNKEFQKKNYKKIIRFLGKLEQIGVDAITVNSPFLCELIKSKYPGITITVGLCAQVGSLPQIKYWENLGADEITLLENLNRNFSQLENILRYTKTSGIKTRLIANNICLSNCPYTILHGTSQSHASQKGHFSSSFHIDYCLLKCNADRYLNPTKLLSSNWIRPEDITYYEELCRKTNNSNFSIKLLDRASTTQLLTKVVKAYISRSYDGNLMDILNVASKKNTHKVHMAPFITKALLGLYNINILTDYGNLFDFPDFYIDNKKLDGFIKKFVTSYKCDREFCNDRNLDLTEKNSYPNETCNYCKTWANKAVSYNSQEVLAWKEKMDHFMDNYKDGKLYNFINKGAK